MAAAAARILGANTPSWLRRGRPAANAPPEDVHYHHATGSVKLPYEPSHVAVRTEMERQRLINHLQAEIHRISTAPCSNMNDNEDDQF